MDWGTWIELQITVSANSKNLPKTLTGDGFSFFMVVVIGLGDSKKFMSCCPRVLLCFFFCSTVHL